MNQTYRQMNALVGRGIGKEAQMQALIAQQRNNKRTVIDPDRIDTERVMELTRRLTEDTDLGMIVRPLPYADIEGDTEATLNVVMQALGLYTFPTVELTDWLRQEIDDDPELEPHSAIEICAGTGWIGRTLGIPTTDAQWQKRPDIRELYLRQGRYPSTTPPTSRRWRPRRPSASTSQSWSSPHTAPTSTARAARNGATRWAWTPAGCARTAAASTTSATTPSTAATR